MIRCALLLLTIHSIFCGDFPSPRPSPRNVGSKIKKIASQLGRNIAEIISPRRASSTSFLSESNDMSTSGSSRVKEEAESCSVIDSRPTPPDWQKEFASDRVPTRIKKKVAPATRKGVLKQLGKPLDGEWSELIESKQKHTVARPKSPYEKKGKKIIKNSSDDEKESGSALRDDEMLDATLQSSANSEEKTELCPLTLPVEPPAPENSKLPFPSLCMDCKIAAHNEGSSTSETGASFSGSESSSSSSSKSVEGNKYRELLVGIQMGVNMNCEIILKETKKIKETSDLDVDILQKILRVIQQERKNGYDKQTEALKQFSRFLRTLNTVEETMRRILTQKHVAIEEHSISSQSEFETMLELLSPPAAGSCSLKS